LEIAKQYNIKEFIAKSRSPSCGCGFIYNGSFSKRLIKGDGVTVALFKRNGIRVISEDDIYLLASETRDKKFSGKTKNLREKRIGESVV